LKASVKTTNYHDTFIMVAPDSLATQANGERSQFAAKPKACLRASPLVKTHGWGLHHDTQARVAAIALEDPAYARFAADPHLKVVAGMRSRRG
jgi:hypothetical protein